MSNRWVKEDRVAWTRSEVMQELEKKVLDNMRRVEAMAQKIAQDNTQAKVDAVMSSSAPLHERTEAIKNLADDEPKDSDVVDDNEVDDEVTKEAMVAELRLMAQAAISKGNIKVAYKIERTIEEILEEEV